MDLHWVPSFAGQMLKSGSFMEMAPLVTVLLNLILLQGTRSVISAVFCWLKVIFLAYSWENGFKCAGGLQVARCIIVKSAFPDLLCPLTIIVMFFILSFSKDCCNFPVSLACTPKPCFLQGHCVPVMQRYHLDISSCVCDLNYFVDYEINWTLPIKNLLKLLWQDD